MAYPQAVGHYCILGDPCPAKFQHLTIPLPAMHSAWYAHHMSRWGRRSQPVPEMRCHTGTLCCLSAALKNYFSDKCFFFIQYIIVILAYYKTHLKMPPENNSACSSSSLRFCVTHATEFDRLAQPHTTHTWHMPRVQVYPASIRHWRQLRGRHWLLSTPISHITICSYLSSSKDII